MNHKIISAASVPSRTGSRTGQRGITETGLKWIALVSMLMDHIYYFFGYTNLIPWWFGLAGRLAAPLFLLSGRRLFPYRKPEKVFFQNTLYCRSHGIAALFYAFRERFRPAGRLLSAKCHAVLFSHPDRMLSGF